MLKDFHNSILAAYFSVSTILLVILHEIKTAPLRADLLIICDYFFVGVASALFLFSFLFLIEFFKVRLVPFTLRLVDTIRNSKNSQK